MHFNNYINMLGFGSKCVAFGSTSNIIFGLGSGILDLCKSVDFRTINNALKICHFQSLIAKLKF